MCNMDLWLIQLQKSCREMAVQHSTIFHQFFPHVKENTLVVLPAFIGIPPRPQHKRINYEVSSSRSENFSFSSSSLKFSFSGSRRGLFVKAYGMAGKYGGKWKRKESSDSDSDEDEDDNSEKRSQNDSYLVDDEDRRDWRRKIRKVMEQYPDDEDEVDEEEKRRRMQKLVADYPLVVEEDDPDWPEDADGRGFNLDQFFDKITIKNVKKDDDEKNEDVEDEVVWQDDDYIRPVKDITSAEWEETVFKDFSPLIILVHNRYKRPKENEEVREKLEKAVHIIWNCRLPSPRCVAVDAVVECDLVSTLQVSVFPEIIFTKAGKILYREKATRTADELSKIMAFFYYRAAKPPCLSGIENIQEPIPSIAINQQS